jgi:DNA polymerase-1
MSTGPQSSLYVLDAHALIFQVFHAVGPMSSPGGLPTNALFGFARYLFTLRGKRPDYLLVAFDRSEKTFRDDLYPAYKANRGPIPDDLAPQIPLIHQLLDGLRVPVLSHPRFEADDVIATVATAAAARGTDVFICTSDKDARQLISDRVKIFSLRKNEIFDRDSLLREWGVTPEQVIDFQSLVGDSVDNVPGVPGIGPKTAAELLQKFHTLDNLLNHVDEVSGAKRKENLQAARATLPLTRQLVTLRTDVPLSFDWDAWRLQEWDAPVLLELFETWGFRRMYDDVLATAPHLARTSRTGRAKAKPPQPGQGELFPIEDEVAATPVVVTATSASPAPAWDSDYRLINTEEEFASLVAQLRQQPCFAIDLETTSLEPHDAEIVGLAFCWKQGEAYYVAVRGPAGDAVLDVNRVLAELKPLLEAPAPAKINQNIKYDSQVLRQQGVHLAGVQGDPMVAHYLLHANERGHNMEVLAQDYLQHQVIPITDLIGPKGKKQLRMDQVATTRVAEYSGEDADVAWRLHARLRADLGKIPELEKLYTDLEIPLIDVLADMEFTGVRLDVPRLRQLGVQFDHELQTLEKAIHHLAGHAFNIASLKQLRTVLFVEMKLPVKRRTGIKGEPSTDQQTLEDLAKDHELPRLLVSHRRLAKLKGTYVDTLPELVNPKTGRLHTSFNQTVAATGRLSASEPNLQNIPIRSEQGEQIRQAFVPQAGWLLLTADYSQVELRLLAHFSGDAALRQAFQEERDVHAQVAAQIYGVPEADVNPLMRRMAKTVNFGVIYGISAYGLAERLEMSQEAAGKFIDVYFARYPQVLAYQQELLSKCKKQGYVATLLGRRRYFDVNAVDNIRLDSSYQRRNQMEREALNMEIQGTAADVIKVAMLNVWRRLRDERRQARLLLQIHDELVFEVPPDELEVVARLVTDEMTGALADRLTVPLRVDVGVGPNWLDVKPLAANAA